MVVDSAMNSAKAIAAWSVKRQFLKINSLIVRLVNNASRSKKRPSFEILLLLRFNERNVRLCSRALAKKPTPCCVNWLACRLILCRVLSLVWCSSYWLNCEARWDMPASCNEFERKSNRKRKWPQVRINSLISNESCTARPRREFDRMKTTVV